MNHERINRVDVPPNKHEAAIRRLDDAENALRHAAHLEEQAAFDTDSPAERGVLLVSVVSMRWRGGYADRAIAEARAFAAREDVSVEQRARLARLADAMQQFQEDTR